MNQAKKYIIANSVVFLALSRQHVREFLLKQGLNSDMDFDETEDDYVDFDLVNWRQSEFVLRGNIPFLASAKDKIITNCRYLVRHTFERTSWNRLYRIESFYCSHELVKKQAAQLKPDYAIMEGCCGILVGDFYRELNKGLRTKKDLN